MDVLCQKTKNLKRNQQEIDQLRAEKEAAEAKQEVALGQQAPRMVSIYEAMCGCKKDAQVVIFVTKMMTINPKNITGASLASGSKMIGFARVFSGTVRKGMKVYLIPETPAKVAWATAYSFKGPMQELQLSEIYMIMGQNMESVERVPAGNILGIGSLESFVFKSATLSNDLNVACFNQVSALPQNEPGQPAAAQSQRHHKVHQ